MSPLLYVCLLAGQAASQQAAVLREIVIVTGTAQAVPLSESDRPVVSIDTRTQPPLLFPSIIDYLRGDPSLDVRQRGVFGIQADLSLQGSSFGQTLVLVNGFRVNDAQSGHHNLDIPIPEEALSRIEILHGAGSTFHGADALGGAVNFITGPPPSTEIRLRTGVGNFGFNQEHLAASVVAANWSESIFTDRDFSTGFRPDRDFRSTALSSETRFKTLLGNTDLLVAGSDRPFGADQFYGNFNSWERTRGWVTLLHQDIGANTQVDFGYRHHSDQFVLIRDRPEIYENNHVSQSWQAGARRGNKLGDNTTLSYGAEADGDQIASNNLGNHARNREAGYINLDFRALRRFSLSLGAREEAFSGGRGEFLPSVAGGWWPKNSVKLRASVSRGFRLPTYTDLYYRDPANAGNPLLKPESAWSFSAGPEFNPGGRISGTVSAFFRHDKNGIDYVKYSDNAPWQATNILNLDFSGVEASVRFKLSDAQQLDLAYTGVHGTTAAAGLISRYAFNYANENAVASWSALFHGVSARTRIGVTQRYGTDPYALWDVAVARTVGAVRPYLQLSNLSNTGYQEIPRVAMPGRLAIIGMEFIFAKKGAQP